MTSVIERCATPPKVTCSSAKPHPANPHPGKAAPRVCATEPHTRGAVPCRTSVFSGQVLNFVEPASARGHIRRGARAFADAMCQTTAGAEHALAGFKPDFHDDRTITMTERLAELLGLPMDAPHLDEALTHPSFANEQRSSRHNQRLEFLGDSVLGFCVSELLCARFPQADEGALTRMRAQLVNADALAAWARKVELAQILHLGRGAAQPACAIALTSWPTRWRL